MASVIVSNFLGVRSPTAEGAHITSTASTYVQAIADRDWDAIENFVTPDYVQQEFRPLSVLGTRVGGESFVEDERALIELAPDPQARFDHIRTSPHAELAYMAFFGTQDGGHYEIPLPECDYTKRPR